MQNGCDSTRTGSLHQNSEGELVDNATVSLLEPWEVSAFQGSLMQARFIEIHQVFTKKLGYFSNILRMCQFAELDRVSSGKSSLRALENAKLTFGFHLIE